jgi:hypothetical protein
MKSVLQLLSHAWADITITLDAVAAVLLAEEFTAFTARTRQACSTPTSPVSVTQAGLMEAPLQHCMASSSGCSLGSTPAAPKQQ